MKCGLRIGTMACIMPLPFHESKKQHHHESSDLNSTERWTQSSSCLALFAVSIIRQRKICSGMTIFAECDSLPINKRRSRFFAALFEHPVVNRWHSSVSFPSGRRISIAVVSRSTPRKTSVVDGPSTFSCLRGRPRAEHLVLMMCKFWAHFSDEGKPMVRKSSRYMKHPHSTRSIPTHPKSALIILGADLSPNGRMVSMYVLPFQDIPRYFLSDGWTEMFRNACWMSIFANKAPTPQDKI